MNKPSFRTLVVNLDRPSRRKLDLITSRLDDYAIGSQLLLDRLRPLADQQVQARQCPSLHHITQWVQREDRQQLKTLRLEPLVDGMLIDVAMQLRCFLTQRHEGRPAPYPQRHPSAKTGQTQSLYWGRHAENRDFCLLFQPATGRFFAKLYLMNRAMAKNWAGTQPPGNESPYPMYHLTASHSPLPAPTATDRYVILPINLGQPQYQTLIQAWSDATLLRSARLCRVGQRIDLHIQIAARQLPALDQIDPPLHWLGVARGTTAAAAYSITTREGRIVRQGLLDGRATDVARQIGLLARQTRAQVVLPDLTNRRDGLYRVTVEGETVRANLNRLDWLDMVNQLEKRLGRANLPPPIGLSPYHLYQTCPCCHSNHLANRMDPSLLVCTTCGFSQNHALSASQNLVYNVIRYQKAKSPQVGIDPLEPLTWHLD